MHDSLRPLPAALGLSLCLFAPLPAQDELAMGKMWTFENPPLAYLEREYGFKPDDKWMNGLRLAALRIGEWDNPSCSASFVSPRGLIMTNHHCLRDKLAEVQGREDLVKNGFFAQDYANEMKLPGLSVHQLVAQKNVTDQVLAGIADGDTDEVIRQKREVNKEKLLTAATEDHAELKHQVVTLYQGAAFQLYSYKLYEDIRLVCAPHLQTAHFGGDPDNFTYPRYSIDFGFARAYENGDPADTSAHYFRWNAEGAKEGDLVFVPGNPGSTDRLLTLSQLVSMRDAEYPITIQLLGNGLEILKGFAKQSPMIEKSLRTTILGWENSYKAYVGMLEGLHDDELLASKADFEKRFRKAVDDDPKLKERFGKVWDELSQVAREETALQPRMMFHNPSYSMEVARGVAITNAVDAGLPEEDRKAAREEAMQMEVGGNFITQSLLIDHFTRARKWMPKDDPYLQAGLGDGTPIEAAARLRTSRLGDHGYVQELLEGGAEAVAASDDVALKIGRILAPMMRANEARQERLSTQREIQGTLLGQALHAVYGTMVSPDATMTLRFSDGVVKGYPCNGTMAPYRTSFHGLYARNIEFDGTHPFDLPQPWLDRKDQVDMTKAVNFVSTNDIIGGNSGSAVVNRDLEVVGLIFDGNIESLPNNFLFRQERPRAVSVHVEAIMESLRKIYGADRVAEELLGENSRKAR